MASGGTQTRYDEIVLYDVDASRLKRVGGVLRGIDQAEATAVGHGTRTSLEEAVDGADIIYCAVRVGGLEGRFVDETVAIEAGAIGQETAGAGGIGFALRTVPVVTEIARGVERRGPHAPFINFTHPVGLVTQAILRGLGGRRPGLFRL